MFLALLLERNVLYSALALIAPFASSARCRMRCGVLLCRCLGVDDEGKGDELQQLDGTQICSQQLPHFKPIYPL